MQIRPSDRVLVLGSTGSGKSEVLNSLFDRFYRISQRLLLDTKPEFELPGAAIATRPEDLDWRAYDLHYSTSAPEVPEIASLFGRLQHRKRLMVCVHELSDLCEYNAGKTPQAVNAYLSKGRVRGLGMLGGSQRPVNVPSRILTDADHAIVMASGFTKRADQQAMADALGLERDDAVAKLAAIQDQLGYHAFLQFSRRDRSYVAHPPLTDAERRAIMTQRLDLT